jgi:ferritin-like metal-binding protein YciE
MLIANFERVFAVLREEPEAEECVGFEGLKTEHDELRGQASSDLVDLIDLRAAARTECYEIAAYEGLRRMAKAMGQERAVELLDENLKQEKEALTEVERIATRLTRKAATAAASAR